VLSQQSDVLQLDTNAELASSVSTSAKISRLSLLFFTKTQTEQPIANCQAQIVCLDAGEADIDFGLCDLGMGTPDLRFVCMREIREQRGPLGLSVESELHFDADKIFSAYAEDARALRSYI